MLPIVKMSMIVGAKAVMFSEIHVFSSFDILSDQRIAFDYLLIFVVRPGSYFGYDDVGITILTFDELCHFLKLISDFFH